MNLDSLNSQQKKAVFEINGPVMILAGAGSGKTRTLVTRITYLINDVGLSSFRVLALTFSNKAAKEMRDRVSSTLDIDVGALNITTFHSFCARILRNEAKYLGLSRNFTIYDKTESKSLMKRILQREEMNLKEISPMEVLYFVDDIKNQGHYVGREMDDYELDTEDEFYSYYLKHEEELHRSNAIDYGGLITGVIELFEKHPEVLERYQEKFHYILVDEYQDTNRAQFRIIEMLSKKRRNICVVGDEDQSIYSWRGADIRNILCFEDSFPDVKILKLEQNYRSTKNIIDAASFVISKNSQRKEKSLWTENQKGEYINIVETQDDRGEANYVAEEIKRLVEENVKYNDISIFYRTNSQSRLLEDSLRKNNIFYRIVGGIRFYDRKEIKDIIAYLKVVINTKDSLSLGRIINIPSRGIGAVTLRKLEQEAIRQNASLWEVIKDFSENNENYQNLRISAKVKSSLTQFAYLISNLQFAVEEKRSLVEIYERLLHESEYLEYLKANKDYETQSRIENLEEFSNAIKQFEDREESATLAGFIETMVLDSDVDNDSERKQVGEVSLMTIHGAKGLEFDFVFVTGVEENVFPSFQSIDEDPNVEEERRLFYVAMTRAMKKLYICFSMGRMSFGKVQFNGPSRFIDEIPEEYYSWIRIKKSHLESSQEDEYDFNQDQSYEEKVIYSDNAKSVESKYSKGMKVLHSLYGEGKILKVEEKGEKEKVLIKFLDGSRKRFLIKFTPLEII